VDKIKVPVDGQIRNADFKAADFLNRFFLSTE
jgi:hypothetical protein